MGVSFYHYAMHLNTLTLDDLHSPALAQVPNKDMRREQLLLTSMLSTTVDFVPVQSL